MNANLRMVLAAMLVRLSESFPPGRAVATGPRLSPSVLDPRIQPSTPAMARSGESRDGSRNPGRLPSRSARRIHSAAEKASCWSAVRPSWAKPRLQSDGYTSTTADCPFGICQPSKGQKCTRSPTCCRRYRSHGRPACVDLATDPCTSKWKADLAAPARVSVNRRQRALPARAAPFPQSPSRTCWT